MVLNIVFVRVAHNVKNTYFLLENTQSFLTEITIKDKGSSCAQIMRA